MNPVGKALWFIESHYASDITLEDIAEAGGVSRYHLSRAFAAATTHSLMAYVRGRRLSEAARTLVAGAPDILAVALDAGYGSHEAFTRAFREQFGLTPEAARAQGPRANLNLVEPLKMTESLLSSLEAPRIVQGPPLLLAGLSEHYDAASSAGIPAQWQRFVPYLGRVTGQVGNASYGVCYNGDDAGHIDYLCGVEVRDLSALPADWSHVRLSAQTYAVFQHREHISTIRQTWNTIWNSWFPQSGYSPVKAPDFERYDERFNGTTGLGGLEIWVPIKT